MAGIPCAATTAEVALSAATAKTVIQLVAPTNQRLLMEKWGIYFDGVSPTAEPVQVRLVKQTTAGTMSALTPVKRGDPGAETLQATAQHTATAEPTVTDVYDVKEIHPQTFYEFLWPSGKEQPVAGGTRIGIECTAPAVVNVRAVFWYQE